MKLHQKILLTISNQNIPRLTELVSTALNQNRGVSYIANKIIDAVDGIYRPNPRQDDKDLAFLVLKVGGPSLLDILPSVSTAYRIAKSCKSIESSV